MVKEYGQYQMSLELMENEKVRSQLFYSAICFDKDETSRNIGKSAL